ncbi:16S rRNA (guanine(527)-N(7))-methyltransferase RsmG [Spirulina sp. CS-785/01]|uniref:16S rRNA (guanine(527)-N(7))-methyltransferase RsmG n=1 Tax=Spirulina sp. CS-785/01 TaxID=3021716 RepID=UPI00232BAB0C|nr:16S rRNA (guanine(527)-N(7))-methyltransferase RsmG [Spirulina sp. CS-785/01]MDB9314419.1 16S rRNA (guanine(527)-N(7))-methyltransferase RsmG [Spirulina sp. CS-785/01]
MTNLPKLLEIWQQSLNWHPTALQQVQFEALYQAILAENKQTNLTRITEPQEFWEKHIWDSLAGFLFLNSLSSSLNLHKPLNIIDIGTGAGFPGLPINIFNPDYTITLLESTRKKVIVLQKIVEELNYNNAFPLVSRAEEVGQNPNYRASYDLAIMRALASPSVCAEYALPLLKMQGIAILYQGQWTEENTALFNKVLPQLGGELAEIKRFKTPLTDSSRHCIYLRKIAETPDKFPRRVGVPKKKPLF